MNPQTFIKERPENQTPQKWLFIIFKGSLVWGSLSAIIYSTLVELSSVSIQEPQDFFYTLLIRFIIYIIPFMMAGTFFGHWLWTYRNQHVEIK